MPDLLGISAKTKTDARFGIRDAGAVRVGHVVVDQRSAHGIYSGYDMEVARHLASSPLAPHGYLSSLNPLKNGHRKHSTA